MNAMWQMMGLRWDIAHMSMISLLYNTITLLFALTIVNRFTKKVSPQLSLSTAELLTIYVMLCLSTAIGDTGERLAILVLALYPVMDIGDR